MNTVFSERAASSQERGKRAFDIAFSLFVLIVTLPVFSLVALLIKCSSTGPVLYACRRVGRRGAPIYCYKFRTMVVDAEQQLDEIIQKDPVKRREWRIYRKLSCDPRVTKIGAFLRKTSLDELPQFVNVLVGDLSVVGPRPPTEEEVRIFHRDKAPLILSIRPGITGRWQTTGRDRCSFLERVRIEAEYVQTRTALEDIGIIVKTTWIMLRSFV